MELDGHRKLLSTVTGLDRYVCGRQNPVLDGYVLHAGGGSDEIALLNLTVKKMTRFPGSRDSGDRHNWLAWRLRVSD